MGKQFKSMTDDENKTAEQLAAEQQTETDRLNLEKEKTQHNEGFKYNPLWDDLKTQGLEIPEYVISGKLPEGKTENQILLDTILDNIDMDVDDDFVKTYLSEKQKPDFDHKKFMENYVSELNVDNIPTDQYLTKIFKEKKYPDEEITKFLSGKSIIEKDELAERYKSEDREKFRQLTEKQKADQIKKQNEDYSKQQVQVQKWIDEQKGKIDQLDNIYGVKVSKAHTSQLKNNLDKYFVPNQETGLRPIDSLMTDDNLVKFILLTDGDGQFLRTQVVDIKEQTKREIEKRFHLTPEFGADFSKIHDETGPDLEDMIKPEKGK